MNILKKIKKTTFNKTVKTKVFKNKTVLILAGIILLGLATRLPSFHLPPIDAHSERQLDTEAVAYFYAFKNHNFLYPQSSLIRPEHNKIFLYFLEFPLYQYIIALFYMLFGYHIELGRLVNFVLYILSVLSLYYFVDKVFNKKVALLSAFFFSFAPASIFFLGHAIHPDIFSTATLLFSLVFYLQWKEKNSLALLLFSTLLFSISVATRPFIFIAAPSFVLLLWKKKAKWWEYPILIFGSLGIEYLWHTWQYMHMDYISRYWDGWILQGREELFKPDILINRLLLKNVSGEVIGRSISLLALIGFLWIVLKRNFQSVFLLFWLAGIPGYWFIVPLGNITHQYYADVFIVPVVITAAFGSAYTWEWLRKKNKYASIIALVVVLMITFINGVHTSRYFYDDKLPQRDFVIADHIKKVIPPDGKMLYLSYGNTAPFMIDHIQGWVLGVAPTDVETKAFYIFLLKDWGAQYIVEAKGDMGLPDSEMKIVEQRTKKIYSDNVISVYTYL